MEYRRDIDGLRAVAVLPVILFHAHVPGLPGGWLGVDIFFVISGYLITQVLLADQARGGIDLLTFYERRVRRILPALFAMLAVTIPFAWVWLHPAAMTKFAESLGLTAVFLSNFYFMSDTGYFANAAEVRPLLHTWSLAVEEQFYLIYPLLLIGMFRLNWGVRRLSGVLAGLAVASLIFGFWAQGPWPDEVFYFPLARAWELLFGAVLAMRPRRGPATGVFSAVGLILIVAALVLGPHPMAEAAVFPGPGALAATLGTGLILWGGGHGGAARLLGWRPLVGIGRISYSAYLWHQPVMAFAAVRMLAPPDGAAGLALNLGLVALSLCLGLLSWAVVEEPVRRRRVKLLSARSRLFGAAVVISALAFGFGLAGHLTAGFAGRVSPEVAALAGARLDNPWQGRCDDGGRSDADPFPIAGCQTEGHGPVVVIYGDSHASMLTGRLMAGLKARGRAGYIALRGGCPALPGLGIRGDARSVDCADFAERAVSYLESLPADSTVVLALRWPLYVEGERFDNGLGGIEPGEPRPVDLVEALAGPVPDDATRKVRLLARMAEGVQRIAARHRLVLVYPVPEAGWDVPDHLARLAMFGDLPGVVTTDRALADRRAAAAEAMLDAIAGPTVFRVRPRDLLCNAVACPVNRGSTALYADSNHLSAAGATVVSDEILRLLALDQE